MPPWRPTSTIDWIRMKSNHYDNAEMIADVQSTMDFLKHNSIIDSKALGLTGSCMGGRVVHLMAAAIPQFKAAEAYYGGNIMIP